jgi:hypothetical protein
MLQQKRRTRNDSCWRQNGIYMRAISGEGEPNAGASYLLNQAQENTSSFAPVNVQGRIDPLNPALLEAETLGGLACWYSDACFMSTMNDNMFPEESMYLSERQVPLAQMAATATTPTETAKQTPKSCCSQPLRLSSGEQALVARLMLEEMAPTRRSNDPNCMSRLATASYFP